MQAREAVDARDVAAAIDEQRLWQRHMAMAEIGATGRGGVNRQALTTADGQARALLLEWSYRRGYTASLDPIGNLFIRREGSDPEALPVVTGSHLDTQPTGGNFDGIFGVLAAFEVLEVMDELGVRTERPIELVVWTNEEGSRFSPVTMGSAVYTSALPLDQALAAQDKNGTSVADALAAISECHRGAVPRRLGQRVAAYIECHIEQGPVLEGQQRIIGVVSGVQGLKQFLVEVTGEEAHAGTTPARLRKDALSAALDLLILLRKAMTDADDVLRFTVGQFEVFPGAPNTVPGRVTFTIDLRHPHAAELDRRADSIAALCKPIVGRCRTNLRELIKSAPVRFDSAVVDGIRSAAQLLDLPYLDMNSGATHDAKFMAGFCPSGMIFIPCRDGISHNEKELAEPAHLAAGTRVLSLVLMKLAGVVD